MKNITNSTIVEGDHNCCDFGSIHWVPCPPVQWVTLQNVLKESEEEKKISYKKIFTLCEDGILILHTADGDVEYKKIQK